MCHPEPYHIFKSNICSIVKKAVPQIDMAWLDRHDWRLVLFWNTGERSESAAETIAAFAKAEFSSTYVGKEKTPLQLAKRVITF